MSTQHLSIIAAQAMSHVGTKTFTVYRPTNAYMDAINNNEQHKQLHLARSCFFSPTPEAICDSLQAISTMIEEALLIPAATVTCDIGQLFRLTNSIDAFWGDNEEVTVLDEADAFMSSSSVGDLFSDEKGEYYYLLPVGILPLSRCDRPELPLSNILPAGEAK